VATSKGLDRLLAIRKAEEEQVRTEMSSAIAELNSLEAAYARVHVRGREARSLIMSSAESGEFLDRIAGLEAIRAADRLAKVLTGKIDAAAEEVQRKRQKLLAKRTERRQVETLCEAMSAQETVAANRRSQSVLDDWHRSQRSRNIRKANRIALKSDIPLTE
jgi:flagellar export protein FliJ